MPGGIEKREQTGLGVQTRTFLTGASLGDHELFMRSEHNPILKPTSQWWESKAVFNPGVAEDTDGMVHILYRAMGRDGISRFGYARTKDGVTIEERSTDPVMEPMTGDELEKHGIEDPRITRIDDTFFITYTAASFYGEGEPRPGWLRATDPPWRVRVSLATTTDFKAFQRHGVLLSDLDNKDAVLFPERIGGKYVMFHRLPPDMWVSFSDDLKTWEGYQAVVRTRPAFWDERRLGAGAPPIRIPEGWLLAYHGSDHHNVYRAGFLLLDANDPTKILGRSRAPVLGPRAPYEMTGQVSQVVFPEGLVLRGDNLFLYYGAADQNVAVATGSLRAVLASLA